ncbi:hypothetical protein T439DRAFT_357924 [Meredithblackwellia eburnea MCA 4105]
MNPTDLSSDQRNVLRACIKFRGISDFYLSLEFLHDLIENIDLKVKGNGYKWMVEDGRYTDESTKLLAKEEKAGARNLLQALKQAAAEIVDIEEGCFERKDHTEEWVGMRETAHMQALDHLEKFPQLPNYSMFLGVGSPFVNVEWKVKDKNWFPQLQAKYVEFFKTHSPPLVQWTITHAEQTMLAICTRRLQAVIAWYETSLLTQEYHCGVFQKNEGGNRKPTQRVSDTLNCIGGVRSLASSRLWPKFLELALICRELPDPEEGHERAQAQTESAGSMSTPLFLTLGRRYQSRLRARGLDRVIARFNERYGDGLDA